jgi:hypothetical protein
VNLKAEPHPERDHALRRDPVLDENKKGYPGKREFDDPQTLAENLTKAIEKLKTNRGGGE